MIKTIRSQSPILLAILLALISLSFIVFYNVSSLQALKNGSVGKIDGRTVNLDDFRMAQQATTLDLTLTRGSLPSGREASDAVNQLTWQRLVLLSAARDLHAGVSDGEVIAAIQAAFTKDGKYDPARYDAFIKNFLASRGISEDRFEQVMRDKLLVEKVTGAIVAPARLDPAEVDKEIDLRLGEVKLSVVRLNAADLAAQVALAPGDVDKEYQSASSQPAYRTPERRAVSYVFFPLSPAEEKLPPKDKAAAKQKVGEKAQEFAVGALDQAKGDAKAFAALAAPAGLTAATTAPFAAGEVPAGLPPSPAFNHAAFELTSDVPVSDAVETDHGYYVLALAGTTPSAPLPLDQVRPLVEKNLRQARAQALIQEKGAALAQAIRAAVAGGKPFAAAVRDAAAAQGLKVSVESLPPFVPVQAATPDNAALAAAAIALQPGQVGEPVATQDGVLIPLLEKRSPAAPATAALIRPRAATEMLEERRQSLLQDWFAARTRSADFQAPSFLHGQ